MNKCERCHPNPGADKGLCDMKKKKKKFMILKQYFLTHVLVCIIFGKPASTTIFAGTIPLHKWYVRHQPTFHVLRSSQKPVLSPGSESAIVFVPCKHARQTLTTALTSFAASHAWHSILCVIQTCVSCFKLQKCFVWTAPTPFYHKDSLTGLENHLELWFGPKAPRESNYKYPKQIEQLASKGFFKNEYLFLYI